MNLSNSAVVGGVRINSSKLMRQPHICSPTQQQRLNETLQHATHAATELTIFLDADANGVKMITSTCINMYVRFDCCAHHWTEQTSLSSNPFRTYDVLLLDVQYSTSLLVYDGLYWFLGKIRGGTS